MTNEFRELNSKKGFGPYFRVQWIKKQRRIQCNRCAICGNVFGKTNRLTKALIDHEHRTGKLRGLLCNSCNCGIGFFKENPKALRVAAAYLEKYLK